MEYSKVKQLEDVTFSGKVVVSDPCYDRSVWCRGELDITPGVYETKLYYSDEEEWGERVAKLGVYRKGAAETVDEKKADFEVGVDSGQAGIFCDTVYPQGETGEYGEKDSFYRKACDLTLGEGYDSKQRKFDLECTLKEFLEHIEKFPELPTIDRLKAHAEDYKQRIAAFVEVPYWKGGTLDGRGIVSSSGYGDGGYDCNVGIDAEGNTTYIEIEFIGEPEEDEESL